MLSPLLMELIRRNLGRDVDAFLECRGLTRGDVGNWVIHTGGPRVLEAMPDALGLKQSDVRLSWDSLSRIGNLSSASVLMVLEDSVKGHRPARDPGRAVGHGAGFCSEMILLRW